MLSTYHSHSLFIRHLCNRVRRAIRSTSAGRLVASGREHRSGMMETLEPRVLLSASSMLESSLTHIDFIDRPIATSAAYNEPEPVVQPTAPWSGKFDIIIEPGLQSKIQSSLDTYIADLAAEGYTVTIQEFTGNAAELRTHLYNRWDSGNGIEGAVFVGDLPYVEFTTGGTGYSHTFAHDLYFMDLDGTYSFHPDGLDEHIDGNGDIGAEIYISRISPESVYGITGQDEVALINDYFDKVHDYRTGELTFGGGGAVYNRGYGYYEFVLEDLYPTVRVVDTADSSNDAYLDVISHDYEYLFQACHSGPRRTVVGADRIHSSEVVEANPRIGFVNAFSCVWGNFAATDSMIGAFVHGGDYCLNALGSAKSGGMIHTEPYYDQFMNGADLSVGQAFQEYMHIKAGDDWYDGMTMQGDPTLKPNQMGGPNAIDVTTNVDENDGDYSFGDLSLREALAMAASLPGDDVIRFYHTLADATITLDPGLGELVIDSDVAIIGLTAEHLTIDAAGNSRVFHLNAGNTAAITGLTITGGYSTNDGGGIYNEGILTLDAVTVSGNTSESDGGGICNAGSGELHVLNATISGNIARLSGGGIHNDGSLIVTNATVTDNRSDSDDNATGSGGGIAGGGTIHNSIIALNFMGTSSPVNNDVDGSFDPGSSYNLIGAVTGSSGLAGTGTLYGTQASPLDPMIDVLADNGGPTDTHALLTGSPALEAGDNTRAADAGLVTDQRGMERFFDYDGDMTGVVDIGAYEYQQQQTPDDIIVSTIVDENDGDHTYGDLSLREAIVIAMNRTGADTIRFDAALHNQIIALNPALGELLVNSDVHIDGPGADLLEIQADGSHRVFNVDVGVTSTISGLSIAGGGNRTDGGGIRNAGTTTVEACAIHDNWCFWSGGGIWNTGVMDVINCAVYDNEARQYYGGGIFNDGTITIDNTTVSGNTSAGSAGGICAWGTATVTNSTITNNIADFDDNGDEPGGGVWNGTFHNCIIAGNYSTTSLIPNDLVGNFNTGSSYNLVGMGDDGSGITHGVNGNSVGSAASPIDPVLGTLADNGGSTMTHALLTGSPALEAGSNDRANDAGLTTDQRGEGYTRFFDYDTNGLATVDIGAFEWCDDIFPPNPPQALTADADIDSVSLDWLDNTEPDLDSYNVYRSTSTGGPYTLIASGLADSEYIDNTVVTGTAYYYVVTAVDTSELESSHANEVYALPGGIIVSTLVDEYDGDRTFGDLSLREALALAFDSPGDDTITFDIGLAGGTITLDPAMGQLVIDSNVDIQGLGSDLLTIDADNQSRVMRIRHDIIVTISDITLTGGLEDIGAGIDNHGNTTLARVHVTGNQAEWYGGGGIHNAGTMDIIDSNIYGNSSLTHSGGIFNDYSWTNQAGRMNIINSAVYGNHADTHGGGVTNIGTLYVVNATISGNESVEEGGGVCLHYDSYARFIHATITDNTADCTGMDAGRGGGICTREDVTYVYMDNTIVAGNFTGTDHADYDDVYGGVDLARSCLVGAADASANLTDGANGNQVGSAGSPLIIHLATLADNGGPTLSHALLPGNPAIDAGNNAYAVDHLGYPLVYDQRGMDYPRNHNGNVDIGALEFNLHYVNNEGHIDLSWQHSTDPDALYYKLYSADNPNGPFRCVAVAFGADHIRAFNVSNGEDYYYAVAMVDNQGIEHPMSEAVWTTPGEPASPADLAADSAITAIHLDWSDNIEADLDHYNIYRSDRAGDPNPVLIGTAPSTSSEYTDTTVAFDDRYAYQVTAVDTSGQESKYPTEVIAWAMPDTLVVSTLTDENDGDFSAGDLSLREALALTAIKPGDQTITFDPALSGGVIVVNSGLGTLQVDSNVDIIGPGADQLALSGNDDLRIMDVQLTINASISGLTFTTGWGNNDAGAILNRGTLVVTNSAFVDNFAWWGGGAIYNEGNMTLNACIIADNHAGLWGGGIFNNFNTSIVLNNCTVSGNDCYEVGGGLYNRANMSLTNTTVTNNRADSNDSGVGTGGGIHNEPGQTVSLYNTIVAVNFNGGGSQFDDITNLGYINYNSSNNLIGADEGDCGLIHGVNGNQVGSMTSPIDPLLDLLADNGGPTLTHNLLAGSPAVNAGNDYYAGMAGLVYDQRGPGFNRFFGTVDIGSLEVQTQPESPPVIQHTAVTADVPDRPKNDRPPAPAWTLPARLRRSLQWHGRHQQHDNDAPALFAEHLRRRMTLKQLIQNRNDEVDLLLL